MKPCLTAGLCALALMCGTAGQAQAAWNNVFQVTCFGCQPRTSNYVAVPAPVVAQAAPNACCAPPQPTCTTRYIQRSYYQPVTVMQTQSYYEPVTTMQTSYYYEPVTSYRYSCYYDPCSCTTQQVATPVTSYELRSKCCPVQSWVQRCAQVPVTTYRQSCYWEPQTTCCNTTCSTSVGTPVVAAPAAPTFVAPQQMQSVPPPPTVEQRGSTPPPPTVEQKSYQQPPAVEQKSFQPPPPTVEQKSFQQQQYERTYPPDQGGAGLRQPLQPVPQSMKPGQPNSAPPVRLEKIVFAPETKVEGQVVSKGQVPTAGAKVLFVSAQRQSTQQEVTANYAGRFQAELPYGNWLVYVSGPDGRQVFHSHINVGNTSNGTPLTLVSR